MFNSLLTRAYLTVQHVALVLTQNPADFLKDNKTDKTFAGVQSTFEGLFASAYSLFISVGIALLVLAGIAAAILFGMLKDNTKVKENRNWIVRVLAAAAIVAVMLTAVGLFYSVGASVQVAGTPTPTPIPNP